MATQYTSFLGLALPVTGELSGSWGDVVNDSITSLLDSAIAGTTTLSTDGDVTLSTTTGASNQARQAILLCSGARTALRTITAPAQSKIYTVINATTGGYSVKVVGAGPTTGVTIVAGESAVIAWNGSDFIKVSNTGGSASFTNVTVSGTTTLSGLTASTALALDASKNVVSVTNTGTGNNVLSASPTLTGTLSGANASLSGTLGVTGATTLSSALTYGGVTLSNAVTGTGNMVLSASPTFTGTLAAAAANFSGNVTLGDASTDTVTVNGYMGVGGAGNPGRGIQVVSTALTGGDQIGVYSNATASSSATTALRSFYSVPKTAIAAFTCANIYGFSADDASLGAGSSVTNLVGVQIADQTQGTNNYGLRSLVSSGSNKWNIYASGTADNYFAGRVGFGTTSLGGGSGQYRFSGSITGATTSSGLLYTPTIQSDATANAYVFHSQPSTAAAAFTITNLVHYHATQATIGAGSTVTNQFGFNVQSTLTGATNNYGFYGGIASGTGRWNLYMAGTADNYFAGNVGIGTSSPGARLHLLQAGGARARFGDSQNTVAIGSIEEALDSAIGFFTQTSTERMRISSAGNVGIGTSSPVSILDVAGTTPTLTIKDTQSKTWVSGDTVGNLDFYSSDPSGTGPRTVARIRSFADNSGSTVAGALSFWTSAADSAATEKMRLNKEGYVGIGTSSPRSLLNPSGSGSTGAVLTLENSNTALTTGNVIGEIDFYANDASTNGTGAKAKIVSVIENSAGNLVSLTFSTSDSTSATGVERMRIDSSGNLGLGVTPSAWASSVRALEMTTGAFYSYASGSVSNFYNLTNAYLNSAGNPIYKQSSFASQYLQTAGQHQWFNAPSGTAGNAISFTQAMTLDASGNLGVGTTSPTARIHSNGTIQSVTGSTGIQIYGDGGTGYVNSIGAYPLVFQVNSTERARIDSSGNLLVGVTTAGAKLSVDGSATSTSRVANIRSRSSGDTAYAAGLFSKYDNDSTTSQVFVQFSINNDSATNGQINGNGANQAAFGTWSDARLKENVVDLPSQLSNIMALRPVEFDYIESEGGGHQIGFIAQEIETIYSDSVGERADGMKTVSGWSKTEARLVKALQEAVAEINQLKSRLDAANL